MRLLWATLILVGFALAGFASSRPSAQAEATQARITPGEKLIIAFDTDRTGTNCTVVEVRGDFLGCKAEGQNPGFGRTSYERWYNLRLIARIDRPAQ